MTVRSTPWRAAYERLRNDFWEAAGSRLHHFRARPVGGAGLLPRKYRLAIEAAEFHRKSTWAPGYPGLLTYEQAESAWLYGDRAAVTLFDRLASLAWQAFLGTRDGKAQYAPTAENDTDRWLVVVDTQLAFDLTTGPNHLHRQDCVIFCEADGTERIDRAECYALPMTDGPIRDTDDRPTPDGPFDRWRITELTTDVFAASAAALDVLLSDPNPEGNRVISWQEWDAHQRSPAFQGANWQIDMIRLAHGRTFPICRRDGMPSSRALPSICPKAEPKPPVELRPDGEMMAILENCYRSLHLIGDDQGLHWVGRQRTHETTCTCDLMARPDAPRSAEWHSLRELRQAVVALFILLGKCAVGRAQMQQFRKAGAVVSEGSAPDVQPFDRLEQRIAATAAAAGVALPDGAPIVPDWVRSPDGLPQSEEWKRWESDWRAVRVAVETRLATLDCCPLPCQAPTVLQVDTREVPMKAPANTPEPLRDAFDAVARAMFQAAEIRRCPPTAWLGFEQQARSLSDAYRTARERYATAELYLRAVADDDGRCAFQDALGAVCRVNDAAGHVLLKSVPFHRATVHLLAVPAFDLAGLLRGMLRQTCRAAEHVKPAGAEPTPQARQIGPPARETMGQGLKDCMTDPDPIIARQRKQAEEGLIEHRRTVEQQRDRDDLLATFRRVQEVGEPYMIDGKADPAYLTNWVEAIRQMCHALDQRGLLSRLNEPPSGLTQHELDAWHKAMAILKAAGSDPGRAVAMLVEVASLPDFAVSVGRWLRHGIPALAAGCWPPETPAVPMDQVVTVNDVDPPAAKPALKPPPDAAVKAYRMKWILGVPTQAKIAELLSQELRRQVNQGQVSRWLREAEEFVSAGGVLPSLAGVPSTKPMPVDPERLDLGPRQDGRTERQRGRRSDDD